MATHPQPASAAPPATTAPRAGLGRPAASIFSLAGLAAAFGAAACCGLPFLLASFGLGAAWLGGVAAITAPYERLLLPVAAALLAIGAVFLARQQRAAARCGPDGRCAPGWLRALNLLLLLAGLALVWITHRYG